jgi:hypothetical protein
MGIKPLKRSLAVGFVGIVAFLIGMPPAATLAASVSPGKPQPPPNLGRYPSLDERVERLREPLSIAANRISDAADSVDVDGYAGLQIDLENKKVNLYWKGNIPASVTAAIASVSQLAKVDVIVAPHSRRELQQEVNRLLSDQSVRKVPLSKSPHMLIIEPDGSGITAVSEVRDDTEVLKRAQFGVTVEKYAPDSVTPTTRQDDFAPWWGGARITGCTSAFGVYSGSSQWMLTARHCYSGGTGTAVYNGAGSLMGSVGTNLDSIDTALIDLSTPYVAGYVYDGAYDDPNSYAKPVIGRAANNMYDSVCSSGSYTGVRCNLEITNDAATIRVNGVYIQNMIIVRSVDGGVAWGRGDSGGPIITVSPSDGFKNMTARGMILAADGNTVVPCTQGVSSQCFNVGYYIPISIIVNTLGVSLMTAPAQ